MAAAYFKLGMREPATFELSLRDWPRGRRYLVTAGLEAVLAYLAEARFRDADLAYLRQQPVFAQVDDGFFDFLREWRFDGEVWALPEGTAAFAAEPLVRVTAPILSAQIVETYLLATIGFQTMVATKAARVVAAAEGRSVIDFGSRRAHGFAAGIDAARAAYLGGCAGTSNVVAGQRFGIPVFGTVAHSFVMAFEKESAAFDGFLQVFPDHATILIDTYDTVQAARWLAEHHGRAIQAVRLDSGDLASLSREVRRIFDDHGLTDTRILASGDLNEYRIAELMAANAPIDGFGVGTDLVTSADAPNLAVVYKLTSYGGRGRLKLSQAKATYPHAKQVWRRSGDDGRYLGDVITRADEPAPFDDARPLLAPVMIDGRVCAAPETLDRLRQRSIEEAGRVPAEGVYPVTYSDQLEQDRQELTRDIQQQRVDPD